MMNAQSNTIAALEDEPQALKEKGWHMVSFFQARQAFARELAYQKATEAALVQVHQAGIRSFAYNDVAYYEVWGRE